MPHSISGMGDHMSHWQLQGSCIIHVGAPNYKVPTLHIRYGGTIRVIDSSHIPPKLWGGHKSHWQLSGSCIIHVGAPNYKVPTLHIRYGGTIRVIDSFHIPPKLWGGHKSHWQLSGSCIQIISYMWGDPITRHLHSI